MINLRGNVIPVIDIRSRLGLEEQISLPPQGGGSNLGSESACGRGKQGEDLTSCSRLTG